MNQPNPTCPRCGTGYVGTGHRCDGGPAYAMVNVPVASTSGDGPFRAEGIPQICQNTGLPPAKRKATEFAHLLADGSVATRTSFHAYTHVAVGCRDGLYDARILGWSATAEGARKIARNFMTPA
jgi:hypothetical protein